MISSFVQLLKKRYAGQIDANADKYIGYTVEGAQRMQSMIYDLLTFSRVTTKAKPFEPVDMAFIAKEVVSDLEARIEETGGTVNIGDLPEIEAEPLQMRQLLQNLIGNALKFGQ